MKNEDAKQYHGWLALSRQAKLLRQDLGGHLFNFYLALILEARWDRNNPQIGCVIGTQAEIASQLHISQSTVSRGIEDIMLKGKYYIVQHKRYMRLGFFPLFLADVVTKMADKNYANVNELYADMHEINAKQQEKYALMQDKRSKKDTQKLYPSFKDNSSFSDEENEDEL